MDPITIGLLAGGGLGLLKGQQNEKMNAQNAEYRRAALKYSPWTGMGDPGQKMMPTGLESALQGAAMGGMIGGMLPAGGGAAAGAGTAAAGEGAAAGGLTGVGAGAGAGALGSKQMVSALGAMNMAGGMGGGQQQQMTPKYSMMNPYDMGLGQEPVYPQYATYAGR